VSSAGLLEGAGGLATLLPLSGNFVVKTPVSVSGGGPLLKKSEGLEVARRTDAGGP